MGKPALPDMAPLLPLGLGDAINAHPVWTLVAVAREVVWFIFRGLAEDRWQAGGNRLLDKSGVTAAIGRNAFRAVAHPASFPILIFASVVTTYYINLDKSPDDTWSVAAVLCSWVAVTISVFTLRDLFQGKTRQGRLPEKGNANVLPLDAIRPCLRLEKVFIASENFRRIEPWDSRPITTISGTVSVSGPDPVARVTNRALATQVARMRIRNSPKSTDPAARAKAITARIQFLDDTGTTVVDVPSARWTEAAAATFPAARVDQARMDFGIDEAHELDIAFKYRDSTVPYALDNAVIASVPDWQSPALALNKGNRWTVLVELSGEWVRTTLQAELRMNRPNEGQAGTLEFAADNVPAPMSNMPAKKLDISDLVSLLQQVLAEISFNSTLRRPGLLSRDSDPLEPKHEALDEALRNVYRFPWPNSATLGEALGVLRTATESLVLGRTSQNLAEIFGGNRYYPAAVRARTEIRLALGLPTEPVESYDRTPVHMELCGAQASQAGTIGGRAFQLNVLIQFHNRSSRILTVYSVEPEVIDPTGTAVSGSKAHTILVELHGTMERVDMTRGILLEPGRPSPEYWWRMFLGEERPHIILPQHSVRLTMKAMNQADQSVALAVPWQSAEAGSVDVLPFRSSR